MKKDTVSVTLRLEDEELIQLNAVCEKYFKGKMSTTVAYLVKQSMKNPIK